MSIIRTATIVAEELGVDDTILLTCWECEGRGILELSHHDLPVVCRVCDGEGVERVEVASTAPASFLGTAGVEVTFHDDQGGATFPAAYELTIVVA